MENDNLSIYGLITKLCEKYISASQDKEVPYCNLTIRKARSKCYEVLLSKKPSEKSIIKDLENIKDPICHLLAWQFQLTNVFHHPQHAEKLGTCIENLQKLNVFNSKAYTNVVLFLLQLREVPPHEDKIMETTLNKYYSEELVRSKSSYTYFDNHTFKLPKDPDESTFFETNAFKLRNKKIVIIKSPSNNILEILNSQQCYRNLNFNKRTSSSEVMLTDKNSLVLDNSIWEHATKEAYNERRTWETFGCYGSTKELPFLSEAGPKPANWLFTLSASVENLIVCNKSAVLPSIITYKQFIKDLKYLLVGIESSTFNYNNDKGKLSLAQNISIEGLSYTALNSYCEDLIFSSSCYQGLHSLSTPNPNTLKYKHNGYIFAELCESIKCYLSYYRVAVFSIPSTTQFLTLHQQTKQLCAHVRVLASVCNVGPFEKNGQTAHGIVLLNNLYQKVMSTTDENILMVLYSILYPCCQVYFSRFLQQWLFEGTVNDPYGEFFININSKYTSTRGRTYWTRSYTLLQDIIPDFIMELSNDVLFCGKAMNLLKLCIPNSPLYLCFTNKRSNLISCCILAKQLTILEHNNNTYYLEASAMSGPRISLAEIVTRSRSNNDLFLSLIAKKRSATLTRIELERKKKARDLHNKKQAEMQELNKQYMEALKIKQLKAAEELEEEIRMIEKNISIQMLHDKIVEEEASYLIDYYKELYEAIDSRRLTFEKRIENLKRVYLEVKSPENSNRTSSDSALVTMKSSDSGCHKLPENKSDQITPETEHSAPVINTNHNLDAINANTVVVENTSKNNNDTTVSAAVENFREAQRNKAKVLTMELGIETTKESDTNIKRDLILKNENMNLTEAQRNKLKVLSSEFDFDLCHPKIDSSELRKTTSIMEINKRKMMTSNVCFQPYEVPSNKIYTSKQVCDNENHLNKNFITDTTKEEVMETNLPQENECVDKNSNISSDKWVNRKQDMLSLDFTKLSNKNDNSGAFLKTEVMKTDVSLPSKLSARNPKFELDKVSPMSIDSTPLSAVTTPSNKLMLDFENSVDITTATTAASHFENAFVFEINKTEELLNAEKRKANLGVAVEYINLSGNISNQDAGLVSPDCLKRCSTESIAIPLVTQIKLLTNELLKYFIKDLHYLHHLNSLRNYFFLLDGEFGRNITEGLFEKLYNVNFPIDLINHHTLQGLVYKAIDYSTKFQENSNCLSFRINNLPKMFDLRDPDIFDCISLTYKVTWPLNILLPSDTIAKYDEVFKFLVKLHRISWVLQNIFQNLKTLIKETESTKLKLLLSSPQYRRLQQCRHVMTHFVQTLQNYILGEVSQSCWHVFEKNLKSVTSFDQLYALHTAYIKNIVFMCLLNQKSAPLRKVLQKIFVVILKFYDYLRSRLWFVVDDCYVHPNFKKLQIIFNNFEELVAYFFKVGHKVVRSGYQPHLLQLLDMLDVNNYYTKVNVNVTDVSSSVSSR